MVSEKVWMLNLHKTLIVSLRRSNQIVYVTLDHKTSHKGTFFKTEIYTSSESWKNKISIDVS